MYSFYVPSRDSYCDWYGMTFSGPDPTQCGWMLCCLYIVNTGSCFHRERVWGFLAVVRTVSKKPSFWMWNCGYTISVSRLTISETDITCIGQGPIYSPILDLGLHFDILHPACRQIQMSQTGHPNARFSPSLVDINDPVNFSVGLVPSYLSSKTLRMWLA